MINGFKELHPKLSKKLQKTGDEVFFLFEHPQILKKVLLTYNFL